MIVHYNKEINEWIIESNRRKYVLSPDRNIGTIINKSKKPNKTSKRKNKKDRRNEKFNQTLQNVFNELNVSIFLPELSSVEQDTRNDRVNVDLSTICKILITRFKDHPNDHLELQRVLFEYI